MSDELQKAADFMIQAMMDEKRRKYEKRQALLQALKDRKLFEKRPQAKAPMKTIAEEIAEQFGISVEEAEQILIDHGF